MNPRIAHWQGKHVWIIGASSGIGAAVARALLAQGANVALSGRRVEALRAQAGGHRHAVIAPLDVEDAASVAAACDALLQSWPHFDLVLIVAGAYNEMRADSFDLATARHIVDVNLGGVLNCLAPVLPVLLRQNAGALGLVSSVAGFRGLPKALAYGPAKAAVINLAETLYLDLRPRGIGVHLINPGFVDTPMTAANDFAMPALLTADQAAQAILRGLRRGQFHIHFPRRFTNWLRLLRLLPYRWYFRLVHQATGL
ncbi:MAG TPA: SDR family NAD(P)-dependent oxidoreductase [Burkholderiaceae bacterium]